MAVQWLGLCLPMQGAGSIPGQGTGILCALGPKAKTWNRGSVVTSSVKTLKMVHIKKKKKKTFLKKAHLHGAVNYNLKLEWLQK